MPPALHTPPCSLVTSLFKGMVSLCGPAKPPSMVQPQWQPYAVLLAPSGFMGQWCRRKPAKGRPANAAQSDALRSEGPALIIVCFFFGPERDELAYPVHHMVLETTSRDQGSELSSAAMIPHMTVVADLTRHEDWLSLKPGYAVGDCHARGLPSVCGG